MSLLSLLAVLLACLAAFGKPVVIFSKFEPGLWLFSHFEKKRLVLSASAFFLALLVRIGEPSLFDKTMFAIVVLLLVIAYLFDTHRFFPEIKRVIHRNIDEAALDPETRILGVFLEGTAVAYPLNVLVPRHIINDRIKGVPVLLSYCALCRSALAFKSTVNDRALYFTVAGVWRRNMIMADRQTETVWQQATGEAVHGKYKGETLELVSGENTTFGAWSARYPQTKVATNFMQSRKGYLPKNLMHNFVNFISEHIVVPGFTDLEGLLPRETVFGIVVNEEAKAYPLAEIKRKEGFEDTVGGELITFYFDKGAEYLHAYNKKKEQELIVEKQWWLGWKEFHPNTSILKERQSSDA